jgi:hypothetical protein
VNEQNQNYGDGTRKRPKEGGQGRMSMEQNAQQPMQKNTGPQRQQQENTQQQPKKKSALKKALPYIIAFGGTSGAVGGLLSYIL